MTDITIYLKQIGKEIVDEIYVAEDRDGWRV
jgi:hypothetical protein